MALSDTSIVTWQQDFLTADTNTPQVGPGVTINKLLDDQARNSKSVIRQESDNKMWERWALTPTFISATSFSLIGDRRIPAIPNRRVKATIVGSTLYGRIISSTFASNITTVTVEWDRDKIAVTTVTADTINLVPNLGLRFGVGDIVELMKTASDPLRVQRKVTGSGSSFANFAAGDPWISDLVARGVTFALVKSAGIDSTISEVQFGLFTPNNFQSGYPDDLITGTFNIPFDGTHSTFTIALPVTMHDNNFDVEMQPTGVVSGGPSSSDWTKPESSSTTTTTFTVSFPSVLAAGATCSYDYVIQRRQ